MTHGSLFSGIGGFDIAASWLGWQNVFQCEIDPFCQKILKYHFPDTELYEDIKTTDFTKYAGTVDVVSGGFPCQPFSLSGKRKGTGDDRYLWPEMLRVLREVRPAWVVAENVSGITSQENGLVFERVCTDMENEGYEIQPFVIPACAVGAPHRRDRVWIVASNANVKRTERYRYGKESVAHVEIKNEKNVSGNRFSFNSCCERIASDTMCIGYEWLEPSGAELEMEKQSGRPYHSHNQFDQFPTQSPVCSRNDGFSFRLADITFSRWRRESIKALGNAVVPQIAYEIFTAIKQNSTN